ncbi:MAG: DUF763 domain-containing protein [Candidatus Korarchaeum sp.]|nr:DUF763 domain-containing protein [Candidatus Korarchaeum sp.]MDW8035059.1 DUF763 domain-containing protein [Candidatus Korarchaeum sp.]
MRKTLSAVGEAELPLHEGKAPRWLYSRMKALGREIIVTIVKEFGRREFLLRVSDPFWFQSLGCVLGYDWHSSGVTTVLTAVIREVLDEEELGVVVCGGKGRRSLETPEEIIRKAEHLSIGDLKAKELVRVSRLTAKVDNAALQDGHSIYHHAILFSEDGDWAVVQQGMNPERRTARRYHWLSHELKGFLRDPHSGIIADSREEVLNLAAGESEENRRASLDLIAEGSSKLKRVISEASSGPLSPYLGELRHLRMPRRIDWRAVEEANQLDLKNYEDLLLVRGVGPSLLRALSLVAEVIYGAPASRRDPARYSFAFGGKDGVPFPVRTRLMDRAVEVLRSGIIQSNLTDYEKSSALRRLASITRPK